MPIVRVQFEDQEHTLRIDKHLRVNETIELEKVSGMTFGEAAKLLDEGSMLVAKAWSFITVKRAVPSLRWVDFNPEVGDMTMEDTEEEKEQKAEQIREEIERLQKEMAALGKGAATAERRAAIEMLLSDYERGLVRLAPKASAVEDEPGTSPVTSNVKALSSRGSTE
jgi:hypothetical protein